MPGWDDKEEGGTAWVVPVEADVGRKVENEWEEDDKVETFEKTGVDASEFENAADEFDNTGGDFAGGNNSGACYNCGQEGHNKSDCPNPRVFKGTCRICEKEGHPAAECPDRPLEMCRNCGGPDHKAAECKDKRALDFESVPTKTIDEAWEEIAKADKERDLDDLRDAIKVLQKADRELTYHALETKFREKNLKVNLIAYEKDVTDTFTLMDLDGTVGRQYHIGYYFSAKAPRESMNDSWPPTPEENLERLQNAGTPVDSKIPKCGNCDELGHTTKSCTEDKKEVEQVQIKCVNCSELGHRARDCTQDRIDRFACRNCKQPGHNSKECTAPRSAEGVTCKNCDEVGHFSKDCPQREPELCRNCGEEGHRARECEKPRVLKCRNCDEEGHISKDCRKPRDWSRVKCSNCEEMGHGRGRCPKPIKQEEGHGDGFGDTGFGDGGGGYGEAGGDASGAAADAEGDGEW